MGLPSSLSLPALWRLPLSLWASLVFLPALAATRTIVLDDGDNAFRYVPGGGFWIPGSSSNHGGATPDPNSAFRGTWHDTTQFETNKDVYMEATFEGTGIKLFCIIGNSNVGLAARADYSFLLDGVEQPEKRYFHDPDGGSAPFYYRTVVYSMDGLSNGKHTVRAILNGGGQEHGTLMLFDYAEVTVNDENPPPQTTETTKATPSETRSSSSESLPTSSSSPLSRSGSATSVSPSSPTNGNQPTRPVSSSPSTSANGVIPSAGPGFSGTGAVADGSSKRPIGATIGGVLAGIVLLGLLVAFFCYRRRRGRKNFRRTAVAFREEPHSFNDPQSDSGTDIGLGTVRMVSPTSSSSTSAFYREKMSPNSDAQTQDDTVSSVAATSPATSTRSSHPQSTFVQTLISENAALREQLRIQRDEHYGPSPPPRYDEA